jgi:Ca2+/Na+ antiporter
MNKYLSWIGLIPITMILTGILTEEHNLHRYTEKTCFGLFLCLIVFVLLYFMLTYFKIKKYLAFIIATILWVLATLINWKIYG